MNKLPQPYKQLAIIFYIVGYQEKNGFLLRVHIRYIHSWIL